MSIETIPFTADTLKEAVRAQTKAAVNALGLFTELARESAAGVEAYQTVVTPDGVSSDINLSSLPEFIAAFKKNSATIISRATLAIGGRRAGARASRSTKGHHFRPTALHNTKMLRFLQGFVPSTGNYFNSATSTLPAILFNTLMCPVNQDGMPTHPLGGAGNANLLIALFSVINRLVDVTKYSVLNHEVVQGPNNTLVNTFNPANPDAGLLPERPTKGTKGGRYATRGFRGLPAALAAPLIEEFRTLQLEKLAKLRDNYAIERDLSNPEKAANLQVNNALVKLTTNLVTGEVSTETMRVADLFAKGGRKKGIWGRIDGGRVQPFAVDNQAGVKVEWTTAEITVGNIITRTIVPAISDLNSLVLVDDAGNVTLLAATVYPSLSSATTLKDAELAAEINRRSSYAPYNGEFNIYAGVAAQSGMSPGQFYLQQYLNKPDVAYTKFYEEAWAQQQAAFEATIPKGADGKPIKTKGLDGKTIKLPEMTFNTQQAWQFVANGLANMDGLDDQTRAAFQNAYNQGQYREIVMQLSPSLWLIMSFQEVITALAAIRGAQ